MGMCFGNENKNPQIIQINLKKKVNSFYFIKEIFSFLTDNKKLEMIAYNKKYRNKLGITLDHYKKLSGKYVKGKRNGKGEEYTLDNNNNKIFEGNYLNGKKNGKGKEYNNYKGWYSYLIFEGEYLNGKRIKV